ncbi:MAG: septum formation initiator family protein [Fibrobacter sp.]|jgi:cell division protein FtsB|nr:septum formation initiator family protein [Fibrobacter sp.]
MHKKKYIAIIAVLFLLSIVVAELLFGKNSIPRQKQVKQEIAMYQAKVDSLNALIEQYKKEIELLENDSIYKEGILRSRYGMSRKGEKVFQLVE